MRTNGPVRRAQLIPPFGVGSTFVLPDGVSVITCGLDHWFGREVGTLDPREVDVSEFGVTRVAAGKETGSQRVSAPSGFPAK